MNKKITLKEVSEKCNISRTTLYKILNNKGYVSEKTKAKALAALEEHGYEPNRLAINLALKKNYTIGFVGLHSKISNYFSDMVLSGAEMARRELSDHKLNIKTYISDMEDPKQQIRDIEKLLDEDVDGFIVVPNNLEMVRLVLEKVKMAEKPVFLLSRNIPGNHTMTYIGCDYFQSGRMAAELLGKVMPNGGTIQPFTSRQLRYDKSANERYHGFTSKIVEYENIKVNPIIDDFDEREDIYCCCKELINNNQNITGIYDITSYPCELARALVDTGNHKRVKMVCFDLYEEIVKYIENEALDAIVFQDLKGQGYMAVMKLFELLCYNKQPDKLEYNLRLDIIIKENLQYFMEQYVM